MVAPTYKRAGSGKERMGADISYEPYTALVRVAITAIGQSEPRLTLVGRWGAQ